MAEQLYKVQVRVGRAWIPAHLGAVPKSKAERLKKAYAIDRPSSNVRLVKEGKDASSERV